ncbi:MAG: hypothetical protein FWD04_10810, partial [Conexibacteraceae bacterium]|nr:hypothetical protein [Conexibacteraceae bacterium]
MTTAQNTLPSSKAVLPIIAIETTAIRVPLKRVYQGSHYHMTHRSTVIVRVIVDGGLVGEAYAGDEDSTLFDIERIINDEIAPKLIGEDAMAVERCWEKARPATFDILRDRRLGLVACAGVDLAIWDLIGKALGQPLWRLWGGYRNSLPMIAIGGYYAPDADIDGEIAELREMGLAGLKFKVGGRSPEEDAMRLRQARETHLTELGDLTVDVGVGSVVA